MFRPEYTPIVAAALTGAQREGAASMAATW
jgi:hypothetical protein